MPKSKVRKKTTHSARTSGPSTPSALGKGMRPSASWYAPVMASLLVLGLAYIVTYYMAGEKVPVMKNLKSWNFAVGFAFLVGGLGMAVRWR